MLEKNHKEFKLAKKLLNKDFKKGLSELIKLSKENNIYALNKLALLYAEGEFVKKDEKIAFKYFKKSFDNGNEKSASNLARCYYEGFGTEQDYKKAYNLFKKTENETFSKFYLGEMYYQGLYVNRDYNKAFKYFYEASNDDCINSKGYLGHMYYEGYGTSKDKHKAVKLLNQNVKHDNQEAIYHLAKIYLTDHDLRDFKLAEMLYKKLINLNNYDGYFGLMRINKRKGLMKMIEIQQNELKSLYDINKKH